MDVRSGCVSASATTAARASAARSGRSFVVWVREDIRVRHATPRPINHSRVGEWVSGRTLATACASTARCHGRASTERCAAKQTLTVSRQSTGRTTHDGSQNDIGEEEEDT